MKCFKNILPFIMLLVVLPTTAQVTQNFTEIQIVEDKAPDKVNVNGKNIPVYEIRSLDEEPQYPGGIDALMSFLSQNIVFPPTAVENGIQGRVLVKFVVTKNGEVANPEIVESVDPSLDSEALRVVSLLKGFTPGVFNGEKVNVWYILPISFRLQDDEPDKEEFDAVPIDSAGYQEMMDLGLAAERDNNLSLATSYFKEAFHINPYVDKLMKSPQGSGALAILSLIYSEKKGDTVKAEKYMKMAEEADPERTELPKWLE